MSDTVTQPAEPVPEQVREGHGPTCWVCGAALLTLEHCRVCEECGLTTGR
jgi:hypothetical protein